LQALWLSAHEPDEECFCGFSKGLRGLVSGIARVHNCSFTARVEPCLKYVLVAEVASWGESSCNPNQLPGGDNCKY
jgi:hypothetical protein